MIIQQVPTGEMPIMICNVDHAATAGQLARAFGNQDFPKPDPFDLLVYATENHDEGWRRLDATPRRNPATGLPYHVGETPHAMVIDKSIRSADANEAHHPWCGLLASLHSWGLYYKRSGIAAFEWLAKPESSEAAPIEGMLDGELARQQRIQATLAEAPSTRRWLDAGMVDTHYKLLQLFDTLALWFQTRHPALRQAETFRCVPAGSEEVTLDVTPIGTDAARITSYPFGVSPLHLTCRVRAMYPTADDRFAAAFAAVPIAWQRYTLTDWPSRHGEGGDADRTEDFGQRCDRLPEPR